MEHAEDGGGDRADAADVASVRWRPWPCPSCGGKTTAIGFLVRCLGSNPPVPNLARNETIDWFKDWEARQLLSWVEGCSHFSWTDLTLTRLDEGSEHLVLFDHGTSEVVKITRPGTYGDYYEVAEDRVHQYDCTPSEYLLRMIWWQELFSAAPVTIGITESGRMVSRQKFFAGEPPTQKEVDEFLIDAGLTAVKPSCWLWKKSEAKVGAEIWVGDARADNFVSAEGGIIPIDLRIWKVPNSA
ncbi:MAG: hypothetical protein KDN18_19860 [Verrucomicrobiae bacterium]|nr:hypothetical protein [Verrucomicrobiae bacterium]